MPTVLTTSSPWCTRLLCQLPGPSLPRPGPDERTRRSVAAREVLSASTAPFPVPAAHRGRAERSSEQPCRRRARAVELAQLRATARFNSPCRRRGKPRIELPDALRLARLPRPDRERVAGTTWGKVSMGYQPLLTSAWFQTMGSFEQESKQDEVYANSVFWVVTRTNECFY